MRLIIFDFDGTIIHGSTIEYLAAAQGVIYNSQESRSKFLADIRQGKEVRDCDISIAFYRCLKGLSVNLAMDIIKNIPLQEGISETVVELKKKGYLLAIVSDGFNLAVDYFKERLGFDYAIANELEERDGILTGEIVRNYPPNLQLKSSSCLYHCLCKKVVLERLKSQLGIALDNMIAVGDGMSDICMLRTVGIGIARSDIPEVLEAADIVMGKDIKDLISIIEEIEKQASFIFGQK